MTVAVLTISGVLKDILRRTVKMRKNKHKQSQPLRIESPDYGSFGTSRCINSRLWFVNNKPLEGRILGYLAKYKEEYKTNLYAYVNSGNHNHLVARFPGYNRGGFYRDLNARTAEAVRALVPEFEGGPLFERRYSEQALPLEEDIEEYFFYCALQPINAGLCEHLSDYPGYNSFHDAICGVKRKVKVVNYSEFRSYQRYDRNVSIEEFTTYYNLEYDRLPGYEHLSQKEYKKLMLKKLEERRLKLATAWKAKGHIFPGKEFLLKVRAGSKPKTTKKSTLTSKRPLVLTKSLEAKQAFLEWYFGIYQAYKAASAAYLAGEEFVKFPPCTYKPPCFMKPLQPAS